MTDHWTHRTITWFDRFYDMFAAISEGGFTKLAPMAMPLAPAFFFGFTIGTAVYQLTNSWIAGALVGMFAAIGYEGSGFLSFRVASLVYQRGGGWLQTAVFPFVYIAVGIATLWLVDGGVIENTTAGIKVAVIGSAMLIIMANVYAALATHARVLAAIAQEEEAAAAVAQAQADQRASEDEDKRRRLAIEDEERRFQQQLRQQQLAHEQTLAMQRQADNTAVRMERERGTAVPVQRSPERNGTERGNGDGTNGTAVSIVEYLRSNPGASYAEIGNAVGVAKSTVSRNVANLKAQGVLYVNGHGLEVKG